MKSCKQSAGWVLVLSAAVGGCSSTPATTRPAGTPRPAPAAPVAPAEKMSTKDYSDRLVQSGLRERAIATIEAAARDERPEVRANAVEASQKMPARAPAILASALKDENAAVRTVAAMNVGRLKLRALVGAVRPLLDDPSAYCRAAAIFAMSACGEPVDATPLASMLLSDPSAKMRAHAAVVLGEIGNPSALPLLRQAIHDGVPRSLQSEAKVLELQVTEAMVRLGETESINAIYSALYPSRPEELESAALAAQILGQLRDRSSIDRLIYVAEYKNQAGQHYSAEVRLAAATALGKLGIVRGGFIADEFWTSETPAIRAQCAFAYGEMGTPDSVAHLETMLGDADVRVRVAAAYGVLNVVDTLGGPRTHNAVSRQAR